MFENEIEKYREDMINDLISLINIKTIESDKKPNMPFGVDVYNGLKYVLTRGNDLNFKCQNYCGFCGQIEAGEGNYSVGVLCNIDVKEPSSKWTVDPFLGQIIDNKIYGKGSLRAKGPLVACLYAMKIINDGGYIPKDKRIRLIVSADKESGYKGINYYKEYEEAPEIGFATDGKFPVIYGEKGTIKMDLNMAIDSSFDSPINIVQISGGMDYERVPSKVNIILSCDDIFKERIEDDLKNFCKKEKLKYSCVCQNKLMSIEIQGKSAFSYEPEKGKNAISYGIKFLAQFDEFINLNKFLLEYEKLISTTYNGEKINCNFEDKDSGKLTFNVSTIDIANDNICIGVDVRYPITAIYSEVLESIKGAFKYSNLQVSNVNHVRQVSFSKDSFVVKKLMKAYTDVTGDIEVEPYVTSGTSYARAISNTVSFGPLNNVYDGNDEWDENISIDYLLELTEIYARGIYELLR